MKIKKILAPTDLSEPSRAGVRLALDLAKSKRAKVLIYHVIGASEEWLARHDDFYSPNQLIEKHKRMLAQFLKASFGDSLPEVSVRQDVGFGVPYEKIIEKAKEEKADLIVMSTHGWSGLFHALIGSVTERVVRRAHCPVLSVHPAIGAESGWRGVMKSKTASAVS
jgi:nucleotide-binding universal stress UspA family protein